MENRENGEDVLAESMDERFNIIGSMEALNETDNVPFPNYEELLSLDRNNKESVDILNRFSISAKYHADNLDELIPAVYFILDIINIKSRVPVQPEVFTEAYCVIRNFLKWKTIDPLIIINYEGFLAYINELLNNTKLALLAVELIYYMSCTKDSAFFLLTNIGIDFIIPITKRSTEISIHRELALYTNNIICCKKVMEPELFNALTGIVIDLLKFSLDQKNAMWAANSLMKHRFVYKKIITESNFTMKESKLPGEKTSLFIQFANNVISNPEGDNNLKTAAICVLLELIPEKHNEEIFLGEIAKIISEPAMDPSRTHLVYHAIRFFSFFFSAVENGSVHNELALRVVNETSLIDSILKILESGKFKMISMSIHILWTLIHNRVITDFTPFANSDSEIVSSLAILAGSEDSKVQVWSLDILSELFGRVVNSGAEEEFKHVVAVDEVRDLINDVLENTSNFDVEFRAQKLIELFEERFNDG